MKVKTSGLCVFLFCPEGWNTSCMNTPSINLKLSSKLTLKNIYIYIYFLTVATSIFIHVCISLEHIICTFRIIYLYHVTSLVYIHVFVCLSGYWRKKGGSWLSWCSIRDTWRVMNVQKQPKRKHLSPKKMRITYSILHLLWSLHPLAPNYHCVQPMPLQKQWKHINTMWRYLNRGK